MYSNYVCIGIFHVEAVSLTCTDVCLGTELELTYTCSVGTYQEVVETYYHLHVVKVMAPLHLHYWICK